MNRKALVVIDIQNDITKHYRDIIDRLNAAIEWAAESDMEIVYIQHNNLSAGSRTFKPGTKGAELVPELKIVSDHIFVKTKSNALTSEAFSEFIRSKDIREFYITGADATACVKSTCFNMTKAGYAVHVISDCVTSYDLKKMPEMLAYYADKGCEVKNFAIYMGMNYQYKRLDNNNFTANSLDDFVRHQTVTECWRKTDNDWKLVPNVYEENWSQVQCREIAEDVVHNINLDQTGFGAFDGERIIGFATVSHCVFGVRLALACSMASGSLGLRPSPTVYSELRQDMCSWFVFRYQRNTGARASAGSSFQWLVKRPGGWVPIESVLYGNEISIQEIGQ